MQWATLRQNPNVIRSAKRLAGVSHPSLKVWVKADKEGTLASCATISADPRVCASTFVGKPALSIEKTGPETAMVGGAVTYNIVVANKGSAIARNVVVTDTVPAGLTSADGKSTIVYQVGDLGPQPVQDHQRALARRRPRQALQCGHG